MCPDEEPALIPRIDLPENVERDDDGCGEIVLEESSGARRAADRL